MYKHYSANLRLKKFSLWHNIQDQVQNRQGQGQGLDPRAKASTLKAKVKAKASTLKAKAKASKFGLKAKAKDNKSEYLYSKRS